MQDYWPSAKRITMAMVEEEASFATKMALASLDLFIPGMNKGGIDDRCASEIHKVIEQNLRRIISNRADMYLVGK